jgi:hypothetical protein
MSDLAGWNRAWNGSKDYRCWVCHMGFMPDEFVYLWDNGQGLPVHEHCLDQDVFRSQLGCR